MREEVENLNGMEVKENKVEDEEEKENEAEAKEE